MFFKARKQAVKEGTHIGKPKTSISKAYITSVKTMVEENAGLLVKDNAGANASLSVKDIANKQCWGISEGSMQTILKKHFHLKKFCTFVCVEVLWPSQPIRVMSNIVSLPNHTFSWAGLVH